MTRVRAEEEVDCAMALKALTEADLTRALEEARGVVINYRRQYGVSCSTAVAYGGLTDDRLVPVSLRYYLEGKEFRLRVSERYLCNQYSKFVKLFTRYFLVTNVDGSFKDYAGVFSEFKKLPYETHLEVTYQNDYLVTDEDVRVSGLLCERCGRFFRYPRDSAELDDYLHYQCTCGGALTPVADGVKRLPANSVRRYVRCNPSQVDRYKNVNLKPLSDFPEDVRQRVRTELEAMPKLNSVTLKPLVLAALNAGDVTLLRAYDAVFSEAYRTVYGVLGLEDKRRLLTVAAPSALDLEEELAALDFTVRLRGARHALKDWEAVRVTEEATLDSLECLAKVAWGEFAEEYLGGDGLASPPEQPERLTRGDVFCASLHGLRFTALKRCMTR